MVRRWPPQDVVRELTLWGGTGTNSLNPPKVVRELNSPVETVGGSLPPTWWVNRWFPSSSSRLLVSAEMLLGSAGRTKVENKVMPKTANIWAARHVNRRDAYVVQHRPPPIDSPGGPAIDSRNYVEDTFFRRPCLSQIPVLRCLSGPRGLSWICAVSIAEHPSRLLWKTFCMFRCPHSIFTNLGLITCLAEIDEAANLRNRKESLQKNTERSSQKR